VIDPAVPPQRQSHWRLVLVLVVLALTGMIAALWASTAEYLDEMRRQQSGVYQEFARSAQRARSDIRLTLRTFLGRRG